MLSPETSNSTSWGKSKPHRYSGFSIRFISKISTWKKPKCWYPFLFERINVSSDQKLPEKILLETSGFPYHVQKVLYNLFEGLRERPGHTSFEQIDLAVDQMLLEKDRFSREMIDLVQRDCQLFECLLDLTGNGGGPFDPPKIDCLTKSGKSKLFLSSILAERKGVLSFKNKIVRKKLEMFFSRKENIAKVFLFHGKPDKALRHGNGIDPFHLSDALMEYVLKNADMQDCAKFLCALTNLGITFFGFDEAVLFVNDLDRGESVKLGDELYRLHSRHNKNEIVLYENDEPELSCIHFSEDRVHEHFQEVFNKKRIFRKGDIMIGDNFAVELLDWLRWEAASAIAFEKGKTLLGFAFFKSAAERSTPGVKRKIDDCKAFFSTAFSVFRQFDGRRSKEMFSLMDIAKKINEERDLDTLYSLIANESLRIVPQTIRASFRIVEKGTLKRVACNGVEPKVPEVLEIDGTSFTGCVAMRKEPMICNDLRALKEGECFKTSFEGSLSELAVPIVNQGQLIGTLNHESSKLNAYSESDKNLLMTLSAHSALAIVNAKRFDDINQELISMAEIIKEINRTADSDKVFQFIMDKARELTGSSFGHLYLFDSREKVLRLKTFESGQKKGKVEKNDAKRALGRGIIGVCAQKKEPINVPDTSLSDDYIPSVETTRSELAVPIMTEGKELKGVLNLEHYEKNFFKPEKEQRLMEIFADHIAVAISNMERVDALKKARDELALKKSFDTLDSMSRILNHTLKNKIAFIPNHLTTIENNSNVLEDPICRERMDDIENGVVTAVDLIKKISALYKKMEPERVYVNSVVKDVLNAPEYKAERFERIEVVTKLSKNIRPFLTNRSLMEVLFSNLILNAFQSMEDMEKGTLTVQSRFVAGRFNQVKIWDTGCGISDKNLTTLRKLEEPSFTTRAEKGGTGFGFWSVRLITNMFNGSLDIQSIDGRGTVVTVEFPLEIGDNR